MVNNTLVSRTMLDAIRQDIIHEGSFFRDQFFPEVIETIQPLAVWDVIGKDAVEIPCVGYDNESSTESFGNFQTQTAKFECFRHGHVITPSVLAERLPGTTEYDTDDKISKLQDLSIGRLDRLCRATEERLAVEALTTGQVTCKRENGTEIIMAKFWDTPVTGGANDPIVTASWVGKTPGDMCTDVMNWVGKVADEGGTTPRMLVVSSDVAGLILKGFSDKNSAMFNPALAMDFNRQYDTEGIRWIANFQGVDVYQCPEKASGVSLLPKGYAILGSPGANVMLYGPTYLPQEGLLGKFTPAIGRRTLYTHLSADPAAYKNIVQTAPLPVIRRKWDCLVIKGLTSE